MTVLDPTAWSCPDAPGPPGGDNTTHHLLDNAGIQYCEYCQKSRAALLNEVSAGHCYVCGSNGVLVLKKRVSANKITGICVDGRACFRIWQEKTTATLPSRPTRSRA